jgi:Methylase involved in ubiquinone/menaquinone biosynthesis
MIHYMKGKKRMRDYQEMQNFYQNKYNENSRMDRNPLEYLRCKEIIGRYLKDDVMLIADIGGATGAFSFWLAELGHRVSLLDYTPLHIDQAKRKSSTSGIKLHSFDCGDAKCLPYKSGEFDLVLLMGPLYHMQNDEDRIQCLNEAYRVLKKGGLVICESISRYANIFEGYKYMFIEDENFVKILDENLETGMHNPEGTEYFTTAFFHTPDLLRKEVAQTNFEVIDLVSVEGFAQSFDTDSLMSDEAKKEMLLKYIRETERTPELLGVSGHHMIIGKK